MSRVLGLMPGTSLDGIDAAVLETDGVSISEFGPSAYRPYSDAEREVLRAHLGLWPEDDLEKALETVEAAHLQIINGFESLDLVGFHGQTLAHDPNGRGTHQCGDGERLATVLQIPVVWDFRSEDIRQGGQGAPLAPFFYFALAKWLSIAEPLAVLNLGGVGNITWIDPSKELPEEPGALLAFDTGPANAIIFDLKKQRFGKSNIEDSAFLEGGKVDEGVLARFTQDIYFDQAPPKTLRRENFESLLSDVSDLSNNDAIATVNQAIAISVKKAIELCPSIPSLLLLAGRDRRNEALTRSIAEVVPSKVQTVEEVGLDGDMMEAQTFAYLAARVARDLPISSPTTTGALEPVRGGKLDANLALDLPEVKEGGPQFQIDDDGPIKLIDLTLGDSDDEDQRDLQNECKRKSEELLTVVKSAANIAPDLPTIAKKYWQLIGSQPSTIGARKVWSLANSLEAALEVHDFAVTAGRSSEELPPSVSAKLKDLLETHRVWFLGHPGAREVEYRASRHIKPTYVEERRKAAILVVEAAEASDSVANQATEPARANIDTSILDTPAGLAALGELEEWSWNFVASVVRKAWRLAKEPPGGFVSHTVAAHYLIVFIASNEDILRHYIQSAMSQGPIWWEVLCNTIRRLGISSDVPPNNK